MSASGSDPYADLLGMTRDEVLAARERLVAEAEARVVDWEWTDELAHRHDLEPFTAQRFGENPRTRVVKTLPDDLAGLAANGLDCAGDLALVRVHRHMAARWVEGQGFIHWATGVAAETVVLTGGARLCFEYGVAGRQHPSLASLKVPTHKDGRLVRVDHWGHVSGDWHVVRTFEYEGDRLVAVHQGDRRTDLVYDDDGKLLRVEEAGATVWYRSSGKEVKAAMALLRRELPERIAAWARRVGAEVVLIAYDDEGNPPLPPALAHGSAEELVAAEFLVAELDTIDDEPTEFSDEEFLDACRAVNQEWMKTQPATQPRRLMAATAKALVASNILAVAMDYEGSAPVTAATRRLLAP